VEGTLLDGMINWWIMVIGYVFGTTAAWRINQFSIGYKWEQ